MKRSFVFTSEALRQYSEWAVLDKKVFSKIVELIQNIERTPYEGIGKPEALKHELAGYWSRRINQEHRLVYRVDAEGTIHIISCRFHYQ